MQKKIVLTNIINAALDRACGADIGIGEMKSLIVDTLTAENIDHFITDTTGGGIIVQAGSQTVHVQPYHTIKRMPDLPVLLTPSISSQPKNHVCAEFRRTQENKYRIMQKHFNSRRK